MRDFSSEILSALKSLKIDKESRFLARRFGYLPYMIARYKLFVDDYTGLLRAFEKSPRDAIRCNPLRGSCQELFKKLSSRGFKLSKVVWSPRCFEVLKSPYSPSSTPEHLYGWFYILDKASCLPPEVLSPRAGEKVADLASAPGGKLTHLAEMMGLDGEIWAFERNRKRLNSLYSNIERMGILNVRVLHEDAYNAPKYGPFDKILLDAPCTGEGVIARDPTRKRSKTPEDLSLMHRVQVSLLVQALRSLKGGGELVYSTCSIAPEENELVILAALSQVEGVEVVESGEVGSPSVASYLNFEFPEAYKCRRLWPHVHESEGFFVCKLRKL